MKPILRSLLVVWVLGVPVLGGPSTASAEPLTYYLPPGEVYDPAIPTPESVLGAEVGEWHVRHDQLVTYMEAVAAASDRVTLLETGRTHENRRIVQLLITSPDNHQRLDEIQSRHVSLSDPDGESRVTDTMPAVVWLAYSVHGNEASGSNAALLAAYHLAAAQSREVRDQLAGLVVILDPSLNPDGLNRFAHWVNSHRGKNLVDDSESREHREIWPGGRTNHYWFDLNRDWLLLTHPESRARVELFQAWKPNVLTDFHEMGTNSTYFFQPGVPSRRNPLTPEENVGLTARIAEYHARAFNSDGRLYYSEESFDDFYYGKGSTYPDAQGCIGILFEQASARGHVQESVHGGVRFPFAIRNQFTTSLSTLAAGYDMRKELLTYQRSFYRDAVSRAPGGGWIFGDADDPARVYHMADILDRHDIRLRALTRAVDVNGVRYEPGSAFVVPRKQPQAVLVEALFEERTEFPDSLFYDVSAWTLPHAFNMNFEAVSRVPDSRLLESLSFPQAMLPELAQDEGLYAYALEWSDYYAPRTLYRLQDAGVRAQVATRPFSAQTSNGLRKFAPGTVVIPLGIQTADPSWLEQTVRDAASRDAARLVALSTGLTPEGIDLGSPSMEILTQPRVLLSVGPGVSGYESGELWHLMDHRMDIRVSLVEDDRLGSVTLADYTHVVLVNGSHRNIDERGVEALKTWIRAGGVLVATKSAVRWVDDQEILDLRFVGDEEEGDEDKAEDAPPPAKKNYADYDRDFGATFTSGSIFRGLVDITHPIGFGYTRPEIAVFRNSNLYLERSENPYATVVQYPESDPLLAGYVSDENLAKVPGTVSVAAHRVGRGTVVLLLDNPAFRGVWYGTHRLFLNALFFGSIIQSTGN